VSVDEFGNVDDPMSEPKNPELPPLLPMNNEDGRTVYLQFYEQRESQLLAAIARAEKALAESKAKDARIAELERTNTWIADKRALKMWTERAESAEGRLRAVSEVLKEKRPKKWNPYETIVQLVYDAAEVDAIFAKLRAIVESK
jgi:hypothetical protein